MKRILFGILGGLFINNAIADETITIGASSVPHAQMLRFIAPQLAKQGYILKVTEFSDYITPNI